MRSIEATGRFRAGRAGRRAVVCAAIAAVAAVAAPAGSAQAAGVEWPRGQLLPRFAPVQSLDVADMGGQSGDERLLFGTLQGVVNRERPQIYLIEDADEGNEAWPSTFAVPQRRVADPWTLVERYRDALRGIVVYDPAQPDSINVATTLAGLRDAVVAEPGARDAALRRAVRPAGAGGPARPLHEPHRRLPLAVRASLAADHPPHARRREPLPRRGVPLRRRHRLRRLPLRRAGLRDGARGDGRDVEPVQGLRLDLRRRLAGRGAGGRSRPRRIQPRRLHDRPQPLRRRRDRVPEVRGRAARRRLGAGDPLDRPDRRRRAGRARGARDARRAGVHPRRAGHAALRHPRLRPVAGLRGGEPRDGGLAGPQRAGGARAVRGDPRRDAGEQRLRRLVRAGRGGREQRRGAGLAARQVRRPGRLGLEPHRVLGPRTARAARRRRHPPRRWSRRRTSRSS